MSLRPRRQAAIQANQKIEVLASTVVEPGARPPPGSRAPRKRSWYDDDDYICDDDEDEEDDEEEVVEEEPIDDADFIQEIPPEPPGLKRKRIEMINSVTKVVTNPTPNLDPPVAKAPYVKPAHYRFTKCDYADEEFPAFSMDADEIEVIEEDRGGLTRKPTGGKKPDYEHSVSDIIDSLEMSCESDTATDNVLCECYSALTSDSQNRKINEEKLKFNRYAQLLFDERQKGTEIVYEDGSKAVDPIVVNPGVLPASSTAQIVTKTANVATTCAQIRPQPVVVSQASIQPKVVVSTASVTSAGQTQQFSGPFIRMPVSNAATSGQVLQLLMQVPTVQNLKNIPVGSTLLIRPAAGNTPGQAFIIPASIPGAPSAVQNQPQVIQPSQPVTGNVTVPVQLLQQLRAPALSQNNPVLQKVLVTQQSVVPNPPAAQVLRTPVITLSQNSAAPVAPRPTVAVTQAPVAIRVPALAPAIRPAVVRIGVSQTVEKNIRTNPALNDCLVVIKGNLTKPFCEESLVAIKPLPFTWPSTAEKLVQTLVKLDNSLIAEKFKESPAMWMVTKGLINCPKCDLCRRPFQNSIKEKTYGGDEIRWQCEKPCNVTKQVERPKIFADLSLKISVSNLLFAVYYWAIQVDVEDIVKNKRIEMDMKSIHKIWELLRGICRETIQQKNDGVKFRTIASVATAQLGRFCVIAAMGENSSTVRMNVFEEKDAVDFRNKGFSIFWDEIKKWAEPSCVIKVCEPKFTLGDHRYKVVLLPREQFIADSKNIGNYLIQHLQTLFKNIKLEALRRDEIVLILSELQWRERFGYDPFLAFTNIIAHLSKKCSSTGPVIVAKARTPSIATTAGASTSKTPSAVTATYKSIPLDTDGTIHLDEYVYIDEYFYSTLQLKKNVPKPSSSQEYRVDIRCHICGMYFDNVMIIKHCIQHVKSERWFLNKYGTRQFGNCDHCLRTFEPNTLNAHDDLVKLKMMRYSCRICCVPLHQRDKFLTHMRRNHFAGEMPYYCEMCSYRTSFHKDLLNHFEKEHLGWSRALCPFCLKTFCTKLKRSLIQMHQHMEKHLNATEPIGCDRCCLTFVSRHDLKDHRTKGHNPYQTFDPSWQVVPYQLKNEERFLSVRVHESELIMAEDEDFEEQPEQPIIVVEPKPSVSKKEESVMTEIYPVSNENFISDSLRLRIPECDWSTTLFPKKATLLVKMNDYYQPIHCLECNSIISRNHYTHTLSCPFVCKYSTNCKMSYAKHVKRPHHRTTQDPKLPLSFATRSCFVCSQCGYVTTDGNAMASHMARMKHVACVMK